MEMKKVVILSKENVVILSRAKNLIFRSFTSFRMTAPLLNMTTLFFMVAVPSFAAQAKGVQYVMGTLLKIELEGSDTKTIEATRDAMFNRVQGLDRLLSNYKPESELSLINRLAGEYCTVSTTTFASIRSALDYAAISKGAFDPTIGPLVHLWGFDSDRPAVPSRIEDIQRATAQVDWRAVELDAAASRVKLKPGMTLDLGGIGKGQAMDAALEIAKANAKVERVKLDFGGQLLFWQRSGFSPQKVGIAKTDHSGGDFGTITLSYSASIATSSQAERSFVWTDPRDGIKKRFGHILDPNTGWPVERTESVTVVAPTATQADALTKPLFILPPREALEFLKSQPGVEALIVYHDSSKGLTQVTTPGWGKLKSDD